MTEWRGYEWTDRPYGEGSFEVPPPNRMPRPLICWGVLAATIESLRETLAAYKEQVDIDAIHVTAIYPSEKVFYPAIVVNIGEISVEQSGMSPLGGMESPHDYVLLSRGNVTLTLFSESQMEIVSLMDLITQAFLMQYIRRHSFFFPSLGRAYVNLGFGPGSLRWGEVSRIENPEQPTDADMLFSNSTSIRFLADHSVLFDTAKVSEVEISAIEDPSLYRDI